MFRLLRNSSRVPFFSPSINPSRMSSTVSTVVSKKYLQTQQYILFAGQDFNSRKRGTPEIQNIAYGLKSHNHSPTQDKKDNAPLVSEIGDGNRPLGDVDFQYLYNLLESNVKTLMIIAAHGVQYQNKHYLDFGSNALVSTIEFIKKIIDKKKKGSSLDLVMLACGSPNKKELEDIIPADTTFISFVSENQLLGSEVDRFAFYFGNVFFHRLIKLNANMMLMFYLTHVDHKNYTSPLIISPQFKGILSERLSQISENNEFKLAPHQREKCLSQMRLFIPEFSFESASQRIKTNPNVALAMAYASCGELDLIQNEQLTTNPVSTGSQFKSKL